MADRVPSVIDTMEKGFTFHEMATIYVGDDIWPSLEAPQPVEVNEGMPLRSERETNEEMVLDSGPALPRKKEASSSRVAMYGFFPKRAMSRVPILTWAI